MDDDALRRFIHEQPVPERLLRDLGRAPILDGPLDGQAHRADYPLTEAEQLVVRCASYGLNNLETADALGIAYETVKSQMKTASRKLRAKNRTHAVALALRSGQIP